MSSRDITAHDCALTPPIAQRILDEGALPLIQAAHEAGLHGDALPSLKTFLRAVTSAKLDAVKVGGRWLTSAAAVRRWVDVLQQPRRAALMHAHQVAHDEPAKKEGRAYGSAE